MKVFAERFDVRRTGWAVPAGRTEPDELIEPVVRNGHHRFEREQTAEPVPVQFADAAVKLWNRLVFVFPESGLRTLRMNGVVLLRVIQIFEKQPLLSARIAVVRGPVLLSDCEPKTQPPTLPPPR